MIWVSQFVRNIQLAAPILQSFLGPRGPLVLPLIGSSACPFVCKEFFSFSVSFSSSSRHLAFLLQIPPSPLTPLTPLTSRTCSWRRWSDSLFEALFYSLSDKDIYCAGLDQLTYKRLKCFVTPVTQNRAVNQGLTCFLPLLWSGEGGNNQNLFCGSNLASINPEIVRLSVEVV